MSNTPLFSIVSPVYRAEAIVPELVRRIRAAVETITPDYEIILVEDGSPDKSWEAIAAECKNEARVKGIQLSRNFGQHYAITAGLDHTKGEWVVVMDCDLQDKPEEIKALYEKAKEGYDIVLAQRKERQDGFLKKNIFKAFLQHAQLPNRYPTGSVYCELRHLSFKSDYNTPTEAGAHPLFPHHGPLDRLSPYRYSSDTC